MPRRGARRGGPKGALATRGARSRPESAEQRAVATLYSACGCSIWQNSVFGHKPIGVTPGIPDLRIKQPDWKLDFDHEVKPEGRRQSEPQYRYMQEAIAMDGLYVLGGVSSAIDFLVFLGLGTALTDTIHFEPRQEWMSIMWRWMVGVRDMAEEWYASVAFQVALDKYGYKPPKAPTKPPTLRKGAP